MYVQVTGFGLPAATGLSLKPTHSSLSRYLHLLVRAVKRLSSHQGMVGTLGQGQLCIVHFNGYYSVG